MKMELINEERLLYLSRQVTHMRLKGVNRRELADIALETLVTKIEMESIAREDLPREQKDKILTSLQRLAELEKGIVGLYFLGKLRGERWTEGSVFDSLVRRYSFEKER